jgi:hypothetical protein
MGDDMLMGHPLSEWTLHPDTLEYTHPDEAKRVSQGFVNTMLAQTNPAFSVTPRQAGKSSSHLHATLSPSYQPTVQQLPPVPVDKTIIGWRSHARFHYVAIYIHTTQRWYITGTGQEYGGNEQSIDQMRAILELPHTDDQFIVTNGAELRT